MDIKDLSALRRILAECLRNSERDVRQVQDRETLEMREKREASERLEIRLKVEWRQSINIMLSAIATLLIAFFLDRGWVQVLFLAAAVGLVCHASVLAISLSRKLRKLQG